MPAGWAQPAPLPAKVFRVAHLRRLRKCEQVAAVCYRVRESGIEFLLVQTRGAGRWTFPKGSTEPGLTHAQAAALEAFEEAGVHGRMEEAGFTQYRHRKSAVDEEFVVSAHLCEVRRLEPPQEANRNRTWFPAEKAKQHLRQDRKSEYGAQLARVVDQAVARIQRLHPVSATASKAIERVPVMAIDLVRRKSLPLSIIKRRR